jgi:hypothetical protein
MIFITIPTLHRRNRRRIKTTAGIAFLSSAALLAAIAEYSIDWHTIDGGGGTSTGGVYSISGTIGQPDANTVPMSGGPYSLQGGFWSLIAVQIPGAPLLRIEPAGPGQATISWEPDDPGWELQEALSLTLSNWVDSASGVTNPITVPVSSPTTFYRLHKP